MTVTTEGSLGAKEPQEMFIDENFNKIVKKQLPYETTSKNKY